MNHSLLLTLAGIVAGAIAAISGFGIGSILTPLLAASIGTKLAVAIVSIPHFIGTALRFAVIRQHVDRHVLWSFGITSAAGGLVGALLHIWLRSVVLGYVLGALLVFAGVMGITGLAARMRFGRAHGMGCRSAVGNVRRTGRQSGRNSLGGAAGIRTAARCVRRHGDGDCAAGGCLSHAGVRGAAVASDCAQWPAAAIATIGVVVGTLSGKWMLRRIPQNVFRMIVASIILALGIWMLVHPGA